tara:strand:- start:682 stop:1227 length:546 start_codon:yes stop_codon:yes gene_type:complete
MSGLLLGLIPLIIFALLDTYASLNVALIALALATIIECMYTIMTFGSLDSISLMSIALVGILGVLAYKQQSGILIKLKPAILSGFLGGFFLFQSLIKQPLLNQMVTKYPQLVPPDIALIMQTPAGQAYFSTVSIYMGYALLVHAGMVAYTGLKSNNFWWGMASTVGFIGVIIIATILATIF